MPQRGKLQINLSHDHRCKSINKISANQTQQCLLKNYIPQPSEIYSRLEIWKSTNVIYHIKSKDEKSSYYTTRWKKRAFDKIQQPFKFFSKNAQQTRNGREPPQLDKKKKKNLQKNVTLHCENLNILHPETGKKAKMYHLINYSQYHTGSPS